MPPKSRIAALVVALVLPAAVIAGCGGDSRAASPPTSAAPKVTTTTAAPVVAKKPVDLGTFVAVAKGSLPIYAASSGSPVGTLSQYDQFGTPMSLMVVGHDPDKLWLEVALQTRPNGSRAWVRRSDVSLRRVHTAIDVNLTTRHLELRDGGEVVLDTPVVIGAGAYPTPIGPTYVSDVIATNKPGGAYGPYAFALAAHSETLTEFAGGDGQVAIHGTNAPYLMGQAVSHGCIRVPNLVSIAFASQVPVGTPVNIHT